MNESQTYWRDLQIGETIESGDRSFDLSKHEWFIWEHKDSQRNIIVDEHTVPTQRRTSVTHVFALTTLRTEGEDIKHQRTIGLYSSEQAANNELFINGEYLSDRNYNQWAVIEEYPITFLPLAREVGWFYWDGESWKKTAKPPILEMIVNFAGIG